MKVICREELAGAFPSCPQRYKLYLRGSKGAMRKAQVLGRLSESPSGSASRTLSGCGITHDASFPSQGVQSDSKCPQDTSNVLNAYLARWLQWSQKICRFHIKDIISLSKKLQLLNHCKGKKKQNKTKRLLFLSFIKKTVCL